MLRNELLIYFPQKEFFSNDEIQGKAELKLPYQMTINGVRLDFFGKEISINGGRKETNTFIKHDVFLNGPGSKENNKNFLGFVKKTNTLLEPGTHNYPFSIKLPAFLPPSYKCQYGKIEYEIKITILCATKGSQNLTSLALVPIGGSLFDMNFLGNNSTPVRVKESKTFLLTKGSFDVTANLESRVFLSGDTIKLRFDFENKTSKTISSVTAKLVQKVDVYQGGKTLNSSEYNMATIPYGTIESKSEKHPASNVILPTTAPESIIQKAVDGGKTGKCIQISYFISVKGEVSLAKDLDMTIPIYVVRRSARTAQESHNVMPPLDNQQYTVPPTVDPSQQYSTPIGNTPNSDINSSSLNNQSNFNPNSNSVYSPNTNETPNENNPQSNFNPNAQPGYNPLQSNISPSNDYSSPSLDQQSYPESIPSLDQEQPHDNNIPEYPVDTSATLYPSFDLDQQEANE